MKRISLFAIVLIMNGLSFSILAQPSGDAETEPKEKLDKDVKEAYEAYEAQDYSLAIELLKKAFSEVRGRDEKTEVLFKIAESYRKTNDYKYAENYYEKAQKLGYKDPVALLYKADMLKSQGEYEDAISAYEEFKKASPNDKRADQAIAATKKAQEWMDQPSRYQVDNMRDLNSREMDFAPNYAGKRGDPSEIYFVSSRDESTGNKEDGWTGQEFMDLYMSNAERKGRGRRGRGNDDDENLSPADKKWSTPVLVDEEILNTPNHEGPGVFDSRTKDFYFTRCIKEKRLKLGCGIYVTEKQGQGWRDAEQVIVANDTAANIGHPALSPDDKILYFVSDDFNTRGEHDIFMTTYDRRAKTWDTPKNLGPKVNTERSEYYPFITDDGYLYFASNGWPGMGGLDNFRIKLGEDGMPAADAEAENMQFPINTNWDDFALIFEPGGDQRGFMSSNRKGGRGSDDIYAVMKVPLEFTLEGVLTSSKTGQTIPQVTVKLEGSDGSSQVVNSDGDGYYIFEDGAIQPDVTYNLNFEKKKFLTNSADVTTIGVPLTSFEYIPSENRFLNTLKLNKELDPIEEPIVLPNVFFDLGKFDLRPEARAALDSVVPILERNPTLVVELRSHTDYRDSDARNNQLSQDRADTSVKYLVSKGIDPRRLVPRGMGETEPFKVTENYNGYGADQFEAGQQLTEGFIKSLPPEKAEVANQINRRTDLKVLNDNFVPSAENRLDKDKVDPRDVIADKRKEADAPGEIYILKGRESLGALAKQFDMNIVQLKKLNGGMRGVRTFEGLQLKVELDGNYEEWDANHYQVVRRGESLKDVAKKVNVDNKVLEELNPEIEKNDAIDEKDLPPGYYVRIKKK